LRTMALPALMRTAARINHMISFPIHSLSESMRRESFNNGSTDSLSEKTPAKLGQLEF
jgi:hypothetical protein